MTRGLATGDEGSSLIELVVTMSLLALLSGLFLVTFAQLDPLLRKQQDLADAASAARAVFAQLDAEVRYAHAVNDPGPGPSGSAVYLEYRWREATASGQQARCTQWQVQPGPAGAAGALRVRSWPESAGFAGRTPWTTFTSEVVGADVRPVFATPGTWVATPADPGPRAPAAQLQAQHLTIDLTVGGRTGDAATRATLVAGNSVQGAAPTPAVCGAPGSRIP